MSVKELPAALGGSVNRVVVAGNEVIKRRIKRQLCAFVGRDGSHKVRTIRRVAKNTLERLLVFLDTRDLRHSGIEVWLTHLMCIDNRQRRLLLERVHPAVPELRLIVEGVQNGRGIALADAAFDTDGGSLPLGEGELWVMAGAA